MKFDFLFIYWIFIKGLFIYMVNSKEGWYFLFNTYLFRVYELFSIVLGIGILVGYKFDKIFVFKELIFLWISK